MNFKTILITGAGSGIGRGAAFGLAKAGHRVIATVESEEQLTALLAESYEKKVNLEVRKLNILDAHDREESHRLYGEDTDILVSNAAIGQTGPVAEVPVDLIRRVFDVNVFGTLELAQLFAKTFAKRRRGKLMFVSSIVGYSTFPFLAPYVASKHALEAITQIMRAEMETLNVQVATINPGPFQTGFNDRMIESMNTWYKPDSNFTPEESINIVRGLFSEDGFQLDPNDMVRYMVELIPQDHHKFRNVYPESFVEEGKKYQKGVWEQTV
ncbi:SDR family oxidoreductase [Paracoccus sp. FO-3]|uniref:SDR family oxidoreductase n=1 Tax=Paracoccus sp. FO-3 TaxID=1335059 RepID=UPI001127D367|nr:SDR family oxidoreductase [Paracoccus sp. FO-3]